MPMVSRFLSSGSELAKSHFRSFETSSEDFWVSILWRTRSFFCRFLVGRLSTGDLNTTVSKKKSEKFIKSKI